MLDEVDGTGDWLPLTDPLLMEQLEIEDEAMIMDGIELLLPSIIVDIGRIRVPSDLIGWVAGIRFSELSEPSRLEGCAFKLVSCVLYLPAIPLAKLSVGCPRRCSLVELEVACLFTLAAHWPCAEVGSCLGLNWIEVPPRAEGASPGGLFTAGDGDLAVVAALEFRGWATAGFEVFVVRGPPTWGIDEVEFGRGSRGTALTWGALKPGITDLARREVGSEDWDVGEVVVALDAVDGL